MNNVSFVKSIVSPKDILTDLPTVLIIGRSNVGKSSFINAFLNRLSLAKTSQTPGKTITMNYYLIEQELYLMDSPGYGYAKRSHTQQEQLKTIIESFIKEIRFKTLIQLIDFKVGPTKDDLYYLNLARSNRQEVLIICTKYDKVIPSLRSKQKTALIQLLGSNILFVSSITKFGLPEIRSLILEATK
jgi:GTP-binding protein